MTLLLFDSLLEFITIPLPLALGVIKAQITKGFIEMIFLSTGRCPHHFPLYV